MFLLFKTRRLDYIASCSSLSRSGLNRNTEILTLLDSGFGTRDLSTLDLELIWMNWTRLSFFNKTQQHDRTEERRTFSNIYHIRYWVFHHQLSCVLLWVVGCVLWVSLRLSAAYDAVPHDDGREDEIRSEQSWCDDDTILDPGSIQLLLLYII